MAKLLIADDSRTSRKILKEMLESAGHEIIGEASDGNEAYKQYKRLLPDVITLDITMPVANGLTALKYIKEDYPDAKIIMVTAAGQRRMMVEAVQNGADDFIAKPFEKDELINSIQKVLTKSNEVKN